MEWLVKFTIIWLSLDVLIIATVWFASVTIQTLCPDWWKRVIIDDDPKFDN